MSEDFEYTGKKFLEVIHDAVNYNNFLEKELCDFIGDKSSAIDFGAGAGEFAIRLKQKNKEIICVEADEELCKNLEKNGLAVYKALEDAPAIARIYHSNVLEHIEDDVNILRAMHAKLQDDGKMFIYVPAFMCLYSEFDKLIGHYRRYTKNELVEKLKKSGFSIERAEYVDSIGFVCWFILSRICPNNVAGSSRMVIIYDRLVFPISRIFDRLFNKFFGKNLLIIASKK